MTLPLHLRRLPAKWQWMEVCVATVLILCASHWMTPQDPYLLHSPFPWIWSVPLLMALRYGLWGGLLSAGLVLGGFCVEQGGVGAIPKSYIIGGLLAIMICGEFGSRWNLYAQQVAERLRYLSERLHETTMAYQLLGMSHQHLEASLASRPLSLRVALARLRGMVVEESEADSIPPSAAERFLQLLAQYFQLETASLFPADSHGAIVAQPITRIGTPAPLVIDDPLVREAIATGECTHVMMDGETPVRGTRYLVVAPAMTSDERILGWLVVEHMRFLSFHKESLHMLNVFLSYFADGAHLAPLVRPVLQWFPDCPLPFAQEFPRLVRLQQEWQMDSRLVVFELRDGPRQDEFAHVLSCTIRGLDLAWDVQRPSGRAVCVLLPFCGEAGVEGYLERIRHVFKERFGMTLDEGGLQIRVRSLAGTDAVSLLADALPRSHDDHRLPVHHRAD